MLLLCVKWVLSYHAVIVVAVHMVTMCFVIWFIGYHSVLSGVSYGYHCVKSNGSLVTTPFLSGGSYGYQCVKSNGSLVTTPFCPMVHMVTNVLIHVVHWLPLRSVRWFIWLPMC